MKHAALPRHRPARAINGVVRAVTLIALFVLMTTSAHAERTLTHEAVINAPVAELWRMFTTSEGAQQWMAPKVKVDLRVGGEIRSSYNPASTLDDEHTIINRILSYEPKRMLSMQNVQAPAGFANPERFQQTWSVIHFEPLGETSTRLRMVGLGYGEGPGWDELYSFFEQGNEYLINVLQQRFESPGGETSDQVLKLLHRLVGGEWIHESESPDGGVFRVRNVVELGADGLSLTARGWLGDAEGMFDHGRTLIYRQPVTEGGAVRFININERGNIARGPIRLAGPDAVEWDWSSTSPDGTRCAYRIEMRFPEDRDRYAFMLFAKAEDGRWTQQVMVDYMRVKTAPEAFRELRSDH